jgi:AraC-like DNA-binding protein/CheY-like chemotaxis protein
MMDGRRAARFGLVTRAHHFLLRVLPFQDPESRQALAVFGHHLSSSPLPGVDSEAVILQCLAILDRHTGGRLPTLVERYLAVGEETSVRLRCFPNVIEELLRYRGVTDQGVQRAISMIETRYGDGALEQAVIAGHLGLSPSTFAMRFRRSTGLTFGEYLRNTRLDSAATLLTKSSKTIKEVWASVGYNHFSNFDHDFRERFGSTPREYRARSTQSWTGSVDDARPLPAESTSGRPHGRKVLIVDDDMGTREVLLRALRLEGWTVGLADGGRQGLEEASTWRPDVVILDYHLPDLDAPEWLMRFRTTLLPTPPVVVFTADLEVPPGACEALGATTISKLCDVDQVRYALELVVQARP